MGQQPERVSGVPTVRHLGEGLGHLPQLLRQLTPLRRVQAARSSSSDTGVFSVSAMASPPVIISHVGR